MEASFLLSNAAPQAPRLNRTVWAEVEKFVREVARSPLTSRVEVFTGPLYLCTEEEAGEAGEAEEKESPSLTVPVIPTKQHRRVMLQSPSEGAKQRRARVVFGVPCPTHFFKVLIVSMANGGTKVSAAFVVPNSDKVKTMDLENFLVQVDDVEEMVGIEFPSRSDQGSKHASVCDDFACKRGKLGRNVRKKEKGTGKT